MIGIITAMNCEAEAVRKNLSDSRSSRIGNVEYTRGILGNTEVVVAVCGVGKVFAGACTQTMIVDFGCSHIFNIGCAGSLSEKLDIKSIISATACVQHDMDTSSVGDPVGLISGINVIELGCDEKFNADFAEFLAAKGETLKTGIIATGDRFIKSEEDRSYISRTFGAVAGEMESAAVGQLCYANNVPYNAIRIITDKAGAASNDEYCCNLPECAVKLAELFIEYICTLS